jgi:thiosulfate dehydrogenase [quinone] large subunit
MAGSARFSPVHALLTPLLRDATTIGYTIAFGELAIGLGILVGLWTRLAAIGGAILSFMFFLTVSFHSSPYFTGADIVFFFAWMPFIVAGGGSRLSIDGWLAGRASRSSAPGSTAFVPIEFAVVQRLCGNFTANSCRARAGAACDAAFCPVLLGVSRRKGVGAVDAVDRRAVMIGGAVAAVAVLGVGAKVAGSQLNHSGPASSTSSQLSLGTTTTQPPSTTTTAPTTTTSKGDVTTTSEAPTTTSEVTTTTQRLGTLLGRASQVSIGRPATFSVPTTGDPAIVLELAAKDFVAYDTVCPHLGCTVQYAPSANLMICPCHGSQFDVTNGAVLNGPAQRGLTKLDVVEGNDGNLYLK